MYVVQGRVGGTKTSLWRWMHGALSGCDSLVLGKEIIRMCSCVFCGVSVFSTWEKFSTSEKEQSWTGSHLHIYSMNFQFGWA